MQLSQLENAVLTSVILCCASVMTSLLSSAGRKEAINKSTALLLNLLSIAISIEGMVACSFASYSELKSSTTHTSYYFGAGGQWAQIRLSNSSEC